MSNVEAFGAIDYCVLLGMLLISTFIGIYYAWTDRNKQSNQEFLMGGKNMGIIPVAMSLMASFMSSITILGYPVEIYTKGTQLWMAIISCVIATVVAAELFLPIFYKMNLTSVNKYLHKRYDSNVVRVVASVSFLLSSLPYLGVVLFGPSLALGAVTKLSVNSSVIIMGIICTFYTSIGGLKAVIWTDVVQFILMIVGMVVVSIKGTIDVGGVTQAFTKANMGHRVQLFNMDFDIYSSNTFWTVLIGTATIWTGSYSTSQIQVQRSCSMPNITKAKKSLYISMPGFMAMFSLACYTGVVVYAYYYDCDPMKIGQLERSDQLMPYFVLQSFGDRFPGIPGLFVACVFSSSLSTLSSGYNALAAIAWDDFLKKFFRNVSESKSVWITRLIAALIGLLSIGVAFLASQVGTIFEAAIALSGAQIGPLFALFVIGVFFPFGNAIGAVTGLLSGQIICLVITVGAIVHKRPYALLPTTTDGCDLDKYPNSTSLGMPLMSLKNASIEYYSPEGMNLIYHISPYLVPFFGFIISLIVGLILSLITGGNNEKPIDYELVNKQAMKFWSLFTTYKSNEKSYENNRNSLKMNKPFIRESKNNN